MPHRSRQPVSRRELIKLGVIAGAASLAGRTAFSAASGPQASALITRPIPSTGENLPVVGLGTNNYSPATPEERAARRAVLQRMPELGGSVVDTAPAYRQSETVLGELMAELDNRRRFFLATKVTAPGGDAQRGAEMIAESLRRLRTDHVDLMQVHNLDGVEALMPALREGKAAGRFRYVGITTSSNDAHARMAEYLRRLPLDFIQVDYSIDNRAAAEKVLPLAQERGLGVLVNLPLGGRRDGNLLRRLSGKDLPPWAGDIDASSWAQLLLKYVIAHPAVTVAIPGTTKVQHLEDNQSAERGRLPDAAMRRRMEAWWDSTFA